MVITLQQLRYFLAAVERGSVSGAAEACYVSQPSLSEQLRRLEKALGVPLFVRTNRGLVLTDAGRLLVPRAERAVARAGGRRLRVDHRGTSRYRRSLYPASRIGDGRRPSQASSWLA